MGNLKRGEKELFMYPTKHEIRELLMDYDLAPVFYEVLSDTYTPVHLFNCLLYTSR